MILEWWTLAKAVIIGGQVVYWWWVRPREDWDSVVWNACMYPGREVDNA